MASFNRVIIIGNLTRDPELKQVGSGQVCRLGIASNRQYKNRQTGAQVQEVCFIDVDVWGPQAEAARQYLQKGRPVLIEGRLKFDSWKDSDGQMRSKHSIVAERVVFLASNQAAELASAEGFEDEKSAMAEVAAPMKVSKPRAKAKSAPAEESADAAMFADEPPFADDLPF